MWACGVPNCATAIRDRWPRPPRNWRNFGFTALWVPDVGGPVFDSVDRLLGATEQVVIATGILNLWMHTPAETVQLRAALTAAHGDRFLLGIGVSHAPLIDAAEPGR